MTFSNPSGPDAAAQAPAYVAALLNLLGDKDPIAVLGELPQWLERRLAGVDDARLRRPEAPGKWSAIEVIQHLADSEMINGYRVRTILEIDRPPIAAYDQDRWATLFDYAHVDRDTAVLQLLGLRRGNLALYRKLTPAHLARAGLHSERGPETAGHLIKLLGAHDLVHRRQLDRILGD